MDADFVDAFYDTLNVIARDGASLGIYLVVTLSPTQCHAFTATIQL